ncbi:MAG TPA: ABC transporter substrate-binding protein [Stellaceae bacterium]|nr:ABC transporter substrate-binding protein [Stellaceae bacterium]
MRLAIPDLISNSYFTALAAAELGHFARHGLDIKVELIFPVDRAYEALRDGEYDFIAGAAHGALAAFPAWRGCKLLGALAQGMYWFLVMRADLGIARGDLAALRGKRIGAAPWVEMGLRRLLIDAGLDPAQNDITIAPVPGATGTTTNFGLTAAQALQDGKIDGFWANGMATEIAVTSAAGSIVLDVRRGDGPAGCFDYTFGALATTDRLIEKSPDAAEAALRALIDTQAELRADPTRATLVGEKRFPPRETDLIAQIVTRDLPYYNAAITEKTITGVVGFAHDLRLLDRDVAYSDIVATRFSHLWGAA